MSDNSQETIADILKEMRHGDNRLAMQQVVMREYADRLEAAWKRESIKRDIDVESEVR